MEFYVNNCKIMESGKSKRIVSANDLLGNKKLKNTNHEKDLEVTMQGNLLLDNMIPSLIISKVRVCCSNKVAYKKKDLRKTEKIQRAATKLFL